MKYRTIGIILGFITAALPFIGFPLPWKTPLYVIIGLLIMFLFYSGEGDREIKRHGRENQEPYSKTHES